MAISVERIGNTFIFTAVGEYSSAALVNALDEVLAVPDFPLHAAVMMDIRRSESLLTRPTRELRMMTDHFMDHAHRFDHRVGLLVEGLLRYGLMRMVSTWLDSSHVEALVSRDREELLRWLETPRTQRKTG